MLLRRLCQFAFDSALLCTNSILAYTLTNSTLLGCKPALYQAHHCIENITSDMEKCRYDVVGPICESSDCFAMDERLPLVSRGDLLAIRSAGAYGEAMASHYNCRKLPASVFSYGV